MVIVYGQKERNVGGIVVHLVLICHWRGYDTRCGRRVCKLGRVDVGVKRSDQRQPKCSRVIPKQQVVSRRIVRHYLHWKEGPPADVKQRSRSVDLPLEIPLVSSYGSLRLSCNWCNVLGKRTAKASDDSNQRYQKSKLPPGHGMSRVTVSINPPLSLPMSVTPSFQSSHDLHSNQILSPIYLWLHISDAIMVTIALLILPNTGSHSHGIPTRNLKPTFGLPSPWIHTAIIPHLHI